MARLSKWAVRPALVKTNEIKRETGGKLYLVFGSSFGTITLRWREPKVITNNTGVDTAERDVVMDCKNCNYCKHDPVSYTQIMQYI